MKLIKPIFILSKHHNNDNEIITDLSEYYDLDNIKVNGKSFKLYDDSHHSYTIQKKTYEGGILSTDDMFKNLKYVEVIISYNDEIINISNKIFKEISDEYMCIHVRRGDRIINNKIDIDTTPENIIKVISNSKPKKVYIMSNKVNELKSLSDIENVYFFTDFNILNKIQDNYYLYCIELNIMKLAKIRCSTFNVNLVNKNNSYYHCYLTNYPGWQ